MAAQEFDVTAALAALDFDPTKLWPVVWRTLKVRARDIASRAAKTFTQTLAAGVGASTFDVLSLGSWKATIIAAFAAAASVAWNAILATKEARALRKAARELTASA